MSLAWSISHPRRLIVVVAKGELEHRDIALLLQSIDSAKASGYRKLVDITGLTASPRSRLLREIAGIVRQRESERVVGPIAIVAKAGASLRQANAFANRAQVERLIHTFADKAEARRWLDSFYA